MPARPEPQARPAEADAPRGLDAFGDASPELLNARVLQQRVDRKFLLRRNALDALLAQLVEGHRAVRSGAVRAARYRTRYFDTPDRRAYHDHRRDRRPRFKVRVRHHFDRDLTFLEIKRKGADGRTTKARLERPSGCEGLDAEALAFIDRHCPLEGARLAPGPSIAFLRATLLGEAVDERITLDWALQMSDGPRHVCLPHIVIVEVKQGRYSNGTPTVRTLRALHVREHRLSKYCVASAMMAPVPAHVFKPVLRAMEQMSG
jgi:hypothetical protein